MKDDINILVSIANVQARELERTLQRIRCVISQESANTATSSRQKTATCTPTETDAAEPAATTEKWQANTTPRTTVGITPANGYATNVVPLTKTSNPQHR